MNKYKYFEKALQKRLEQKHFQQLRCALSLGDTQSKLINFNDLDFLGLSTHPYVKQKTIDSIVRWGAGSSSSRLLIDHLQAHHALENKLANLLGFDSTLLFPSTHAMQELIFGFPGVTWFVERSYPAQMIKSYMSKKSVLHVFDRSERKPLPDGPDPKIIVAPSICPKTGAEIDLRCLMAIAVNSDALICIDDTYAFGMLGKRGLGLAANRKGVDLTIGSFSKATGSFGAYIGCNQLVKNYLTSLHQTGALPPASLGAIDAALEMIPDMDAERSNVLKMASSLRSKLKSKKHQLIESNTHILGMKTNYATDLSDVLAQNGIITMPHDGPGLTLNVTVKHTGAHLDALVTKLGSLAPVLN